MQNTFLFSKKIFFPLLAITILFAGLISVVFLSQQSQDQRSRAQMAYNYSIWNNTTVPASSTSDAKSVELGVKFRATVDGTITGIKFYKGSLNTGTHIGNLWSSSGQLLAQATFTNETTSGWQQVNFATPVAITANTTYLASYFAPQGRFSYNNSYFTKTWANGPLIAPSSSEAGGNGIYTYASTSAFPTSTYGSRNYWVDVLFEPSSTTATPTPSPIACPQGAIICEENKKPGNPPSEWEVSGGSNGYATKMSVTKGETQEFKINTSSANYRVDIYRMGYYGGMGARKVATINPSATLPQTQPSCITDTATGLFDCGNWAPSASWTVPTDAVSGVYIAKFVSLDSSAANHMIFVVRDDDSHSDILLQTSDATWQAYNQYGGANLYKGNGPGGSGGVGRAYKVSYNRPQLGRSRFFRDEYALIRWLESNGYDVSYTSTIDTATRGSELLEHKLFISSGHDEYWSKTMRANVEAARDAGVNLAFFTANEVFWKTRLENSIDGMNTPNRTLVCYKETHANAKIDPSNEWTGTWRDPRFAPLYDGGNPENSLTGTFFTVNSSPTSSNKSIKVPAEDGKMRFWRNTPTANLLVGGETVFPINTLGYEWDEPLDNGFRPAGLIHLSTTTETVDSYIQDYGSTYGTGTATHHLTLYKHPSGALVFGSGTVQWSWGLDSYHDGATTSTDTQIQQATVNLFADMGVQPASLQQGLILAVKSTDTTPPTSAIISPSNGSMVTGGTIVLSGTAADAGGVVGGVEVSVDGGTTWHPATGRTNWQYNWMPTDYGTVTIKVRAIDDSGNIQQTPTQTTINIDPSGTTYRWWKNTSSAADTNKFVAAELNDTDTAKDVSLSTSDIDDTANAWEAGGILWSTVQSINSFSFINGSWTTTKNGAFTANLKLQFTTDGITWTDSGWTISPAYAYDSPTTAGQTYTFNGIPTSVKGVRLTGQVRTPGADSYHAIIRELNAQ